MELQRRGFLTGLAAFFGLAMTAPAEPESGDVFDALMDLPPGEKPKAAGRVVHVNPGDVIDLEFRGMRCRAVVEEWNVDVSVPRREDIGRVCSGPYYLPIEAPSVRITLTLRSVDGLTQS